MKRGSPSSLPFFGGIKHCIAKKCGKRCRLSDPSDKKFGRRVGVTAGVLSIFSIVCPVLVPFAVTTAVASGGYNVVAGVATENAWRAVQGTLSAASAGFGAMGDQAATIVAHGLDAAQGTGTITQAVIEEDPVAGAFGILSGVFVALSVDHTIQTSGANNASQHAQKVFKDASETCLSWPRGSEREGR